MRFRSRISAYAVLVLFLSLSADATTVLRMDLEQMVARAGSIFRGTVVDVVPGTLAVGGGTLPITTFVFRVDEAFKGALEKEGAVVEVTMAGSVKRGSSRVGDFEKFSVLPELPNLERGSDYLVLLTPESPGGLSISVGLGQGAFAIFPQERQEVAVNALGNANIGASGPVPYADLAARIKALVGE